MIVLRLLLGFIAIIFMFISIFSTIPVSKITRRLNQQTKAANANSTQADLAKQREYLRLKKPARLTLTIWIAFMLILVATGFCLREMLGNVNLAFGFGCVVMFLFAGLQLLYRRIVVHGNQLRAAYLEAHPENELHFYTYNPDDVMRYRSANATVIVLSLVTAVLFLLAATL